VEEMNKDFVPNSYQTPNAYTDSCMAFLTSDEWKVLSFFCRRIFGFNKRQDRVSVSQITDGIVSKEGERLEYGTGLSAPTVRKCLAGLESYGILVKVEENDPHKNKGPLYELQLDGDLIDLAGLMARDCEDAAANQAKMATARAARSSDPSNAITGVKKADPSNAITVPPSNAITGGVRNGITTQYPGLNPVQKTEKKDSVSFSEKNIWPKIQSQLQSEMSKALFETWVSPTFPIGWQGDVFKVGCHNQYAADWLTSRISAPASRMLQGFSERPSARVEFVVAEKVAA
jgi:hypothetical protein